MDKHVSNVAVQTDVYTMPAQDNGDYICLMHMRLDNVVQWWLWVGFRKWTEKHQANRKAFSVSKKEGVEKVECPHFFYLNCRLFPLIAGAIHNWFTEIWHYFAKSPTIFIAHVSKSLFFIRKTKASSLLLLVSLLDPCPQVLDRNKTLSLASSVPSEHWCSLTFLTLCSPSEIKCPKLCRSRNELLTSSWSCVKLLSTQLLSRVLWNQSNEKNQKHVCNNQITAEIWWSQAILGPYGLPAKDVFNIIIAHP